MFPVVFLSVAALSVASLVFTESSYVRLETSETSLEVGERFTLQVFAQSQVPVNAVDITVSYDAAIVEVVKIDRKQSILTSWVEEPVIAAHEVNFKGGTFSRGFIGEHQIASIEFRTVRTGLGVVQVTAADLRSGLTADTLVHLPETTGSKISFFVYDENTVPETTALNITVKKNTDINGDGKVTLSDVRAFVGVWRSPSTTYDFNADGKMNFSDFSIILADSLLQ